MWRDIISDNQLLNLVAKHWILPIAAGYLPHAYNEHLAGGRLVALSKAPKPGVRPINITDTWRRIAAKGLLRECIPSYRKYFQEGHPRVFQFAAATPNGATVMYQIVRSIIASLADGNSEESDPVQIFSADVKNAFNEESRQHIRSFYAKGCPVQVDPNDPASSKTWDILWRYIQAHYNVNGQLKFYHGGRVHYVLSQNGIQQGDTLGTVLFSAPIHPIFEDIANTFPSLLILAFADNSFFIGPRSQILQAADLYNTKIHELGLRLNPMESVIYAINCDPNHCPPSMTTPGGMVIPCTAHGITMLGAPLGTVSFV